MSGPQFDRVSDSSRIARDAGTALERWQPDGRFRTLHQLSAVRLAIVRDRACRFLRRNAQDDTSFAGLSILDIGCGIGLLSEPLSFSGADVVGIDASQELVRVAEVHASLVGAPARYLRATTAELVATGKRFDLILSLGACFEATKGDRFLEDCARMLKPGGVFIIAALNRSVASLLPVAIGRESRVPELAASRRCYIKPAKLEAKLGHHGLRTVDIVGIGYNPFLDCFRIRERVRTVYAMLVQRPNLHLARSR